MSYTTRLAGRCLVPLILILSAPAWAGNPPQGWVARTSPTTKDLNGIAFGAGQFVAVGNSGTILTSPDGVTWSIRAASTTQNLKSVAYGTMSLNFAAVGALGTIVFSDDKGVSWTTNSTSSSTDLLTVASRTASTGERWVAAGSPNKVLTTTHPAVPWGQASWPSGAVSPKPLAVAGRVGGSPVNFVETGSGGQAAISADGTTWQPLNCGFTGAITAVTKAADNGNIYLAVGDQFDARGYTLNLVSIIDSSCTVAATSFRNQLKGMAYGDGYVVGVGPGSIGYNDPSGARGNWTAMTPPNNAPLNAVVYGNGTFVAVGNGGVIVQSTSGAPTNYLGCFTDDEARALPAQLMDSGATTSSCVAAAKAAGYAYAGLQYAGACFAGNVPGYTQIPKADEAKKCDTKCAAAPGEVCGGAWHNSIYKTGVTPPVASAPTYKGCYSDAPNRALPVVLSQSGATVESCVAAARARGLLYAGLQYKGQCFAGNTLGHTKVPVSDEKNKCNTKCTAAPGVDCGGAWYNSIYATGVTLAVTPAATAYKGCYSDAPNRALPVALMPSGATVASCFAAARSAGYAYAGLQFQGQCYAGNTLGYVKVLPVSNEKIKCDTACIAAPGETCGGGWYNSIYATH